MAKKKKKRWQKGHIIFEQTSLPAGGVNLDLFCSKCEKPIVKWTPIGEFCEDECFREEAEEMDAMIEDLVDAMDNDDDMVGLNHISKLMKGKEEEERK